MPMNKTGRKMMKSYGDKKGKEVFYAMENKGKVPGMAKGGSMKPMGLTKSTSSMNTGIKKCLAPSVQYYNPEGERSSSAPQIVNGE